MSGESLFLLVHFVVFCGEKNPAQARDISKKEIYRREFRRGFPPHKKKNLFYANNRFFCSYFVHSRSVRGSKRKNPLSHTQWAIQTHKRKGRKKKRKMFFSQYSSKKSTHKKLKNIYRVPRNSCSRTWIRGPCKNKAFLGGEKSKNLQGTFCSKTTCCYGLITRFLQGRQLFRDKKNNKKRKQQRPKEGEKKGKKISTLKSKRKPSLIGNR